MRTFAIVFIVVASFVPAFSQTDTIHFVRGLPQSGDTLDRKDSIDHPPFNVRANVSADHLPSSLRKSLDKRKLFSGWRNGVIQFDRNTGFYHLSISDKKVIREYVLARNGDIISIDEKNREGTP